MIFWSWHDWTRQHHCLRQIPFEQHAFDYEASIACVSPALSAWYDHTFCKMCVREVTEIKSIHNTHNKHQQPVCLCGCDIKRILFPRSISSRSVCMFAAPCVLAGTCTHSHLLIRPHSWVQALQSEGNKKSAWITHRQGVFKSAPTSQCHSNSLHLTYRNHNRGRVGCLTGTWLMAPAQREIPNSDQFHAQVKFIMPHSLSFGLHFYSLHLYTLYCFHYFIFITILRASKPLHEHK